MPTTSKNNLLRLRGKYREMTSHITFNERLQKNRIKGNFILSFVILIGNEL